MTLRVAIVGAGYFSQFHIDGWQRITGATIVGICDRDIAKAEATALPAYDNVQQMLSAAKPDVLDIVLPPQGHAVTIQAAIASGVQTIICQKPFCQSLNEARKIVELASAAQVRLIVHENFRFQPWYRSIKSAIDAGRIGEVQQATFRLRPGDGQGPSAYLDRQPYFRDMPRLLIHETGVHLLDVFRFLFGNPTSVYADLRQVNPVLKGEDAGFVICTHQGGVRTLFDGNRCLDHVADNPRRTMGEALIEGTAGTITLTGDGAVHLRPFNSGEMRTILPPDSFDGFGGDCTHALQAHVVAGLRGERPIENLATDYLTVLEIEAAVYQSSDTGQRVDLT